MNSSRIVNLIEIEDFKELIERYKFKICLSPHAIDHLSNAQKTVFAENTLKQVLLSEEPRRVGKQKNGRLAVFYRRGDGYLKMIVEEKENKLEVITFINTDTMPNLSRT